MTNCHQLSVGCLFTPDCKPPSSSTPHLTQHNDDEGDDEDDDDEDEDEDEIRQLPPSLPMASCRVLSTETFIDCTAGLAE
jgi:hypothetical protein